MMRTTAITLSLTPFLALLGMAMFSRPVAGDGDAIPKPTPEQAAFFETKIRPLLIESCFSCHSKDASLGGLRLDSRAAILKGGDTGTSLVAGDPEKSLLIQVVKHVGKMKMPQGGAKLSDAKIADLAAWVQMGAPWPESAAPIGDDGVKAPLGDAHWRSFWSLQPVKKPIVPKVKNTAWATTPIDAFILAKLEAKKLTPAPPAEKRALLRRLSYDLIGLPPTAAETDAFVKDAAPNAYEKAVDRLLASPRYGERWARLWLDVARYADTKGYVFNEDRNYYNAYTYRDWVINSFNQDLPYDKFVIAQLAADKLPEVQNSDDKRPLAALGFLTVGRRFLNQEPDIMDDRIDVTMRGLQGMTVACARCHNHKFDPIPTQDYYALYGVFASASEQTPPISPKIISAPWEEHNRKTQEAENNINSLIDSQVKRLREMGKDPAKAASVPEPVKKALQSVREDERPNGDNLAKMEAVFEPEKKIELDKWRQTQEALKKNVPTTPEFAMAMADNAQPRDMRVFKRGNPGNPGDEAPRRFPLCLTPAGAVRPIWKDSGRLELAQAIASKDNPRTARVFVNRVWMQHFGAGLVRTPSDFGKQGEKPTHPELLDYLAYTFMQDNWSVKRLHKRIVMTNAYRQSADVTAQKQLLDPENRLVSRQARRRLDLEQMRDSLLLASGKLDTAQIGGKSVELWTAEYKPRRSVYGFIERQNLPGLFRTFDFASPDSTSAQRFRTTVPQQALFLMNSNFAVEQAKTLAARPDIAGAKDDAARVWRLYTALFNRPPDDQELRVGVDFLRQPVNDSPLVAVTWQYGWGGYDAATQRTTNFTPLTHFGKQGYSVSDKFPDPTLGYLVLSGDGGHPGNDVAHAIIRRWIAPQSGVVTVRGTLKHGQKEGDGVHARLISSKRGLLGEWTAHAGEVKTDVPNIAVLKGETLDFAVDPITGPNSDSFVWSPTLEAADGKPVARAARDFAAPPSPRLTRREQYAQALLLTNEFMFVD